APELRRQRAPPQGIRAPARPGDRARRTAAGARLRRRRVGLRRDRPRPPPRAVAPGRLRQGRRLPAGRPPRGGGARPVGWSGGDPPLRPRPLHHPTPGGGLPCPHPLTPPATPTPGAPPPPPGPSGRC